MHQVYHSNATTNHNIRKSIQLCSAISNIDLAAQFNTSVNTISKWKDRDFIDDVTSRPNNINYALTDIEKALIVSIRRVSWVSLGETHEMMIAHNPKISQSSVYRCLVANGINKVPQEQKEKANKFKEYQPGYLHIDVTYLPLFNGQKYYLFVAIDRATRMMTYLVYEDKTAASTESFFDHCITFFPFKITHILTDNGLEFTNYLIRSKKGELCKKPSKLDLKCSEHGIDHRLTRPATPKTNGMVERVNGTIKNNTILIKKYADKDAMNVDLMQFLVYYNLYRRHGSLRKELKVKTPFDAIEKWFRIKPEIFNQNPDQFYQKLLALQKFYKSNSSTTL